MQSRLRSLWVLQALLSHWWRHPVQLGTLITGLLAATALWSGVQALNQQARFSYDQAAARFGSINQPHIVSTTNAAIAQSAYIQLRRSGWQVSPLVEGTLTLDPADVKLNVIGIEPMTLQNLNLTSSTLTGLPCPLSLRDFLTPPWQVWLSPATARHIKPLLTHTANDGFPFTPQGDKVSIEVSSGLADNELITDVYLAQYWLNMEGQFSRLLLEQTERSALPPQLASHLQFVLPQSDHDISRLTASFHLNLSALSLLAFIVGLLMVYSAIHLALTQRLVLRRILFSCGVSERELMAWLLAELLLLGGLIALPGLVVGYWIAALLLPDLSASLNGLYGAQISGDLQLSWQWWLQGALMAWGGTLIAAIVPLFKLFSHNKNHPGQTMPSPWQQKQRNRLLGPGIISFWLALLTAWLGESLLSGFLLLALIFLTAALLMPLLLEALIRLGQRLARTFSADSAILQWLLAEARLQVPQLSVALVALLLALSTSIGVGGMVDGFRNTFSLWLDQRLAADVYVRTDHETQAEQVIKWLNDHPAVSAILPSAGTESLIEGMPVELRGIKVHSTYSDHWPLLSHTPATWQNIESGAAVMINEQLARRLALRTGDSLTIRGLQQTEFNIAAVFSDYGNPKGQVIMALDTLFQNWPKAERGSIALRVEPIQLEAVIQALTETFSLSPTQVIDQQAVKRYSLQLFERTFAVTQALNLLVLAVAAIALFSSLLSLSALRLNQIAPIWACGVSRWQLVITELLRLMLLAFITALLAVPLGLIISYCLVTVINVRAFGWALPWHVFPMQWLYLVLAALCSAFVAAIVPVLKLRFSSAGEFLKGFADDR